VLRRVRFVSDDDRKAHIGDPDAIDSNFPVVRKALGVDQSSRRLRLHSISPFYES
jgi:hypothetical protein